MLVNFFFFFFFCGTYINVKNMLKTDADCNKVH